jgi:hypothetical protein
MSILGLMLLVESPFRGQRSLWWKKNLASRDNRYTSQHVVGLLRNCADSERRTLAGTKGA